MFLTFRTRTNVIVNMYIHKFSSINNIISLYFKNERAYCISRFVFVIDIDDDYSTAGNV